MPYDTIKGQGHGHPKVAKMADFKDYILRRYACNQKTNGELRQFLKFNRQIFDIGPRSASHDLQTWGVPPFANGFCLLQGVYQQSLMGL